MAVTVPTPPVPATPVTVTLESPVAVTVPTPPVPATPVGVTEAPPVAVTVPTPPVPATPVTLTDTPVPPVAVTVPTPPVPATPVTLTVTDTDTTASAEKGASENVCSVNILYEASSVATLAFRAVISDSSDSILAIASCNAFRAFMCNTLYLTVL